MTEHTHRALIVEDDDSIVEVVEDQIESLGHHFDRAANQEKARSLFDSQKYCYVLLDLEIPVKLKRPPRREYGANLLEEMRRKVESCRTQIIIMTSHGTDGPYLAVEMMKKGADDYLCKPFGVDGRSPVHVIKEALQRSCKCAPGQCVVLNGGQPPGAVAPTVRQADLKPFGGSTLSFYPDRIELSGRTIITDKGARFSRPLLELLGKKKANGKYMTYSGNDIAEQLHSPKGQNDVAGYVRHLRKRIRLTLQGAGISCDDQDVIMSGGSGYRLNPWIEVEHRET